MTEQNSIRYCEDDGYRMVRVRGALWHCLNEQPHRTDPDGPKMLIPDRFPIVDGKLTGTGWLMRDAFRHGEVYQE